MTASYTQSHMADDDRSVEATSEERLPLPVAGGGSEPRSGDARSELASQWRRLGRAATLVALITSPVAFVWFHDHNGWSVGWSILATFFTVIAFRGIVDVVIRKFIPWPSLFGEEDLEAKQEDVVNRRRAWFWRKWLRLGLFVAGAITIVWFVQLAQGEETSWGAAASDTFDAIFGMLGNSALWFQFVFFFFLFVANFMLFFGPMLLMGISQIRSYEPGDADWGVKLDDVRGQAEAKEEVRRVVNLWQSGEAFELAGGKRERGLLMLGAPGTGKTMLSKAIATGFNCPFVSIPGSGFAQTFIGMDVIVVRYMAGKAKRLARKWGGQCIVFIDEIDAVGMRRRSLGTNFTGDPGSFHDFCFFGPNGALTPTGDLVLETRAWRERLFAEREGPTPSPYPELYSRLGNIVNQMFPGMMGGMGQLALNQLLVVMDGIGDPPFWRRFWTNRINTFLDATYIIPQQIGKARLRMPRPKPRAEQIFFIGACNAPLESLDPALVRPGRMGRHVWFRTPTRQDRLDIFNLYLGKVAHDHDLDTDRRRDELARITNGYSPAMIEQVCSMALTISHHQGRDRFGWEDIVDAMTTIESGTAINVEYVPEETRAVAIHEAGHAVAAHVYMKGTESTRLSIRRRGRSLGHHQALEKEERFSSWRHEEMGRLIWTLGAMAAERVFYGENSTGVGGDVMSATARAAWMVGSCAMAPERVDLDGRFENEEEEEAAREKIMKRFEQIGLQIMQRAGAGGPFTQDPIAGVLGDPSKRALAAELLGQAYIAAHHVVAANREAVEHIADVLVERRELHGDEVLHLLDDSSLRMPDVDLLDEATWPRL
jgi:ATP-dependent Zn protease